MQERRLSNNCPRSRPGQSIVYGHLTLPSKSPALTFHTPIISGISPATQPRLHPHTSTPSLHGLDYYPSPTDETSILTKSTNSLLDQTLPRHKMHRSAVSKTFTLTRSDSASVSPSRRSRESSESSDTCPSGQIRRQRTATLVLNKLQSATVSTTIGANGVVHQSSPQTPVGIRRLSNKTDELEFVVFHPDKPRPHVASFVPIPNGNIFTTNNPAPNSPLPSTAEVMRPRRRTTGGVYILSSSPLTS